MMLHVFCTSVGKKDRNSPEAKASAYKCHLEVLLIAPPHKEHKTGLWVMKQMTAESWRKKDFIQNSQNCWEGRQTSLQAKVSEIQHLTHNRLGLREGKANVVAVSHWLLQGIWQQPHSGASLRQDLHFGSNGKPLCHCHDWKFNILAATCPGQKESSRGGGQPPFASHKPRLCLSSWQVWESELRKDLMPGHFPKCWKFLQRWKRTLKIRTT